MRRPVAAMLSAVLLTAAAVGVAGCGSSSDSNSSSPPPTNPPIVVVDMRGKKTVDVDAKDNLFEPNGIQVDVGTTVTWHNVGQVVHNVQPMNDLENFGGATPFGAQSDKFGPGATYSFTFGTSGTFNYTCTLHTGMDGRVVVG
jgi:plastocyanin